MVASNGNDKPIVKALIEAKKEFKTLTKNKVNPHYKSRYADLAAVCDAVDDALAKHGLTYVQPFEYREGLLFINTSLMHTSGDSLSSTYPINVQGHKPQEVGGAITYGRRYALTSLLGIAADDDDDGNDAPHDTTPPRQQQKPAAKPQEPPKKAAPPGWQGTVRGLEDVIPGRAWKVIGQMGEEFYTKNPTHADVARTAHSGGGKVTILFHRTPKGNMEIDAMDPVIEEGK